MTGTGSGYSEFNANSVLSKDLSTSTGGNQPKMSSDNHVGGKIMGGKRFKKGSKEAKAFMAKLRAMRGMKTKKGGNRMRYGGSRKRHMNKGGEPEDEENSEGGAVEIGNPQVDPPVDPHVDPTGNPTGDDKDDKDHLATGGRRHRKHKGGKKSHKKHKSHKRRSSKMGFW